MTYDFGASHATGQLRKWLKFAEDARARFYAQRDMLRAQVEKSQEIRRRKLGRDAIPVTVDVVLNRWTALDDRCKAAVADNRWGLDQTTAYGVTVIVEQNNRIIELLERIAEKTS